MASPPQPRESASPQSVERRRQSRGLTVFALAVLILSLLRFGLHRVFTPGWWRLW